VTLDPFASWVLLLAVMTISSALAIIIVRVLTKRGW
jgi:hypothetical protein